MTVTHRPDRPENTRSSRRGRGSGSPPPAAAAAGRRRAGRYGTAVTLDDLAADLRRFAAERDWGQFHTPKNLAISLAVETGEVLEHVQWGSDTEIAARLARPAGRAALGEELADVLIYLVRLADIAGVDLLAAATAKLAANGQRYPADEVRGSSAKRAH